MNTISIGWPWLFTASQILCINLIKDGIMGVAPATEPCNADIMEQKGFHFFLSLSKSIK
ncbi:cation transporting ATPase C-terminal domain-containing protein [Algoriphagus aquimarinus]|uniref:cation transporting ATPase C-terminal domain-containing protein n=1 Tax=Algoriphagus aquimarinus TaxID=237018 RepID=UPI0030D7E444